MGMGFGGEIMLKNRDKMLHGGARRLEKFSDAKKLPCAPTIPVVSQHGNNVKM